MQNSLVFRDSSVENVGNIRLARIKSIRLVNLLNVDVHFNIGNNWVEIDHMSNKKDWSLLLLLPRHRFFIHLCLFFVLFFFFFGIVSFVTTTLDKLRFQSQVRLSQVNLVVPLRLKLKPYAVIIE